MRNFTSHKLRVVFLIGFFLTCLTAVAQTPVPPAFAPRLPGGNIKIKGDILFVGNNMLNRGPNPNTALNDQTIDNNSQTMEYINIDNGATPGVFNSSSADLALPTTCSRVVYAGLYWASAYPYERSTSANAEWTASDANRYNDYNQVKFKLPTATTYTNVTADNIIFDGKSSGPLNQSYKNAPIVCYKDVTSLVQAQSSAVGTYTFANLRAAKGKRTGSSSAGWVMVIIYEDNSPATTSKFISTFDGYAGVANGSPSSIIDISGFVTLPGTLPVNVRLGVGALEGDRKLVEDNLKIKGNLTAAYSNVTNTINPLDNFFNSTISDNDAYVTSRNPSSKNTLGFDLDMIKLANTGNTKIKNNETGAKLQLVTDDDTYGAFLATFAVDIIEPDIRLVKKVKKPTGEDMSGQNVTLGATLDYIITFDNVGNDDATNFVIKDVLPVNTTFSGLITMPTVIAAGGSYTYNAATHTILINVPSSLVKKDELSIEHEIKIRVNVASTCNELTDACSSIIRNSAYATYKGVVNTATITDDPSVANIGNCGVTVLGPANFLVDVSACVYSRSEVLCNGSLVLTAGDGYGTYTWYKEDGAVDIPMGTTQSITVTSTGVYYYDATPIAPCIVPIHETITVTNFTGLTLTNPVIAVADISPNCPNDGTPYPKIFLCGAGDSQYIPTGISSGIVRWQKLTGTCSMTVPADCPKDACPASAWSTIYTGANYTVTDAGEYRIAYDADGTGSCITYFFFYVSKNTYTPALTVKDIVCTTNGEIKVTNVPASYQIRLINQGTNTVVVDYPNTNPVFPITAQGAYTIEVKQTGVPNGCVFRQADITVSQKTMTVDLIPTHKTCSTSGSIRIRALNVSPNYTDRKSVV